PRGGRPPQGAKPERPVVERIIETDQKSAPGLSFEAMCRSAPVVSGTWCSTVHRANRRARGPSLREVATELAERGFTHKTRRALPRLRHRLDATGLIASGGEPRAGTPRLLNRSHGKNWFLHQPQTELPFRACGHQQVAVLSGSIPRSKWNQ